MGKRNIISSLFGVAAVCALLVSGGRPALAQSAAALNGIVKDASSAVVPDAGVTLTNVRTGSSQTRRTNSAGPICLCGRSAWSLYVGSRQRRIRNPEAD